MKRRPALSGARALQVLNMMAAQPERGFTLSDVVRMAEINVASAHAVLSTLVEQGYAWRDEKRKTYRLGPALYAAGQAMVRSDPLLTAILAAGSVLAEITGLSVQVAARVGADLVGVSRHGWENLSGRGLAIGRRVPLKPPIGATLAAWFSDAEINEWIERGGIEPDSDASMPLRMQLSAIRKRGYLVTLNSDDYAELSSVFSNRDSKTVRKDRDGTLSKGLFGGLFQADSIVTDMIYDVAYLGAPIFDASGHPLYSIIMSGFSEKLTGAQVEHYSTELKKTCTDIMRSCHHV